MTEQEKEARQRAGRFAFYTHLSCAMICIVSVILNTLSLQTGFMLHGDETAAQLDRMRFNTKALIVLGLFSGFMVRVCYKYR